MPVKVLIVDDSSFFRNRIADMLSGDPRITIVGSACNGREAVDKVKQLRPDVVTMDVEMPQMNGIEALKVIMRESPTHVMMLSSLTHEGATTTMQALEAGAADYLAKDIREWMDSANPVQNQLRDKVVALGNSRYLSYASRNRPARTTERSTERQPSALSARLASVAGRAATLERPSPVPSAAPEAPVRRGAARARFPDCKLVVIGSSTGGPAALQQILTRLPASFPYPILLVQHMPKSFTTVFAERLNQQCNISVKEAEDGDVLKPGLALLAPGGHQMIIDPRNHDRVRVMPGDERTTYKPSVDISYGSAANCFGAKVLAVILTGMGADGTEGAKVLKRNGATVWAQDEKSSTIYGMPKSVVEAGLADEVLDLGAIAELLGARGKV
jgi:two-component system chemotaxis response regulator CheB